MNVVSNVRYWKTGMGNKARCLLPVPACLSLLIFVDIAQSQEIASSSEVLSVKEAMQANH